MSFFNKLFHDFSLWICPNEPRHTGIGYFTFYYCPICGTSLVRARKMKCCDRYRTDNYCPVCGKKNNGK